VSNGNDRRTFLKEGAASAVSLLVLLTGCGAAPAVPGDAGGAHALAAAVQAEVTAEGLGVHVDSIVRHERLSGSPGEFAAIDHIVRVLKGDGVPVTVDTFMAYISDPISASVQVVGANFSPHAITIAASGSVDGLEAAVIDLGDSEDLPAFMTATGENLVLEADGPRGSTAKRALPVARGKIVLFTGRPGPDEVTKVSLLGAAGAVVVNAEERLNDLTTTTVWGAPSLRDYHRIPTLPVAEVTKSDGERIRALMAKGPIRIRMSTRTNTGWKQLRLATARIPGPTADAPYVVFGGHIDAWYHGGTDEGASNAAMLQLARAFHRHRDAMKRGLVVAWWPGHSNGRYAGSTWFVDHHFDELRRRAVAYVNVDGIGQMGAKRFGASATASLAALARSVILNGTGDSVRTGYPGRNSDESFNGVGLPLLQINHSRLREDGGYWWWHTPDDTRDKVDLQVLETDADLYAAAIARLVAEPNFPIDVMATVERLGSLIEERQRVAGSRFDLSDAAARRRELADAVRAVESSLPVDGGPALDVARVAILRPLHRVLYTLLGPYHPDPATDQGDVPGLAPVELLAADAPASDRYQFAEVTLLREKARLLEALDDALAAAHRARELVNAR
jgi:hypothetical protein